MFFTPTLNSLLNRINKSKYEINIRLLCLSNGNYDKIGDIREKEFLNVMKNLRIENYEIINDDRLQDNINYKWDKEVVYEKINEYLYKNNEEAFKNLTHIITFDEYGVTNHPNHISCYEGVE
jgi:N-acetylglucosaminylphosphatidylinositol deacetylase